MPRHFLFSCSQYVRRFLQSPYASQFADAFVAGVVALHENIDLAEVDEIVAGMEPEQQKVIYLRLARRAAIEGIPELTEYASAKADAVKIDGVDRATIRAPCSMRALPPSPPTRSTRPLPS